MKKALITGGAGFIGSNIVKRLLELYIETIVLDNLSSGSRENLLDGAKFIEGDVCNRETLGQLMLGCDHIFHLAASVGNKRSIDNPFSDSLVNLLGTINVLEAAKNLGIKRIVFSSSAAIYGETYSLPIREDHPQNPDTPYGISKLAAEKMCLVYNKLFGMQNVCLRYFNVYGLNQRYDTYGNVIPIFAQRIMQRKPLTIYGDGEQSRDFINVNDVATANLQAAQARDASGVFNIASGTKVTVNSLAALIQEISGVDVGLAHAQPRLGDVRASLADIRAAKEAFGFSPSIALRDGLTEYVAWVREESVRIKHKGRGL